MKNASKSQPKPKTRIVATKRFVSTGEIVVVRRPVA